MNRVKDRYAGIGARASMSRVVRERLFEGVIFKERCQLSEGTRITWGKISLRTKTISAKALRQNLLGQEAELDEENVLPASGSCTFFSVPGIGRVMRIVTNSFIASRLSCFKHFTYTNSFNPSISHMR